MKGTESEPERRDSVGQGETQEVDRFVVSSPVLSVLRSSFTARLFPSFLRHSLISSERDASVASGREEGMRGKQAVKETEGRRAACYPCHPHSSLGPRFICLSALYLRPSSSSPRAAGPTGRLFTYGSSRPSGGYGVNE